jgi:hypothetical protein
MREGGVQQLLPEFPAHGENGSALDDEQLALDRLALEAEQIARQDQVSGARDRQEFRDAFDEAKE